MPLFRSLVQSRFRQVTRTAHAREDKQLSRTQHLPTPTDYPPIPQATGNLCVHYLSRSIISPSWWDTTAFDAITGSTPSPTVTNVAPKTYPLSTPIRSMNKWLVCSTRSREQSTQSFRVCRILKSIETIAVEIHLGPRKLHNRFR